MPTRCWRGPPATRSASSSTCAHSLPATPAYRTSLAAAIQARVDRLPPAGESSSRAPRCCAGDSTRGSSVTSSASTSWLRCGCARSWPWPGCWSAWARTTSSSTTWRRSASTARWPQPLASAYHRRAADLLSDQPESMAAHAHAAGEPGRAAQGWLLAGQAAMGRSAVEDAIGLYDRAIDAAEEPLLRARVLLARARAQRGIHGVRRCTDRHRRGACPRKAGPDRRLEMAALRARGGDVPVALRRPSSEVGAHLEAGLRLASGLGDRAAEADFTTRLTVLEASRLRLVERSRQGRGGPGARAGVVFGGSDPVRPRRCEERPRLSRRG